MLRSTDRILTTHTGSLPREGEIAERPVGRAREQLLERRRIDVTGGPDRGRDLPLEATHAVLLNCEADRGRFPRRLGPAVGRSRFPSGEEPL